MTVAMAAENKGKSNSSTSRHTSLMSTKSTPTLLICKSEKQARRGREDYYYCIWVSLRVSVFVSLCVSRVQAPAQNFQRMGGGVGREPYAHLWGARVLEPTNG